MSGLSKFGQIREGGGTYSQQNSASECLAKHISKKNIAKLGVKFGEFGSIFHNVWYSAMFDIPINVSFLNFTELKINFF